MTLARKGKRKKVKVTQVTIELLNKITSKIERRNLLICSLTDNKSENHKNWTTE